LKNFKNNIIAIITLMITLLISSVTYAGTAFYTGERTTGMTKQCYYDYLGNQYTITLDSYKLCPLNITV
jgi:hypothetical protein